MTAESTPVGTATNTLIPIATTPSLSVRGKSLYDQPHCSAVGPLHRIAKVAFEGVDEKVEVLLRIRLVQPPELLERLLLLRGSIEREHGVDRISRGTCQAENDNGYRKKHQNRVETTNDYESLHTFTGGSAPQPKNDLG